MRDRRLGYVMQVLTGAKWMDWDLELGFLDSESCTFSYYPAVFNSYFM
jgi:hypothetical protein